MSSVFTRKMEERPELILNHELQPVHEDSKIRSEFGSFLGTIGRQCVPLDYVNWSRVPESEKNGWWEFVKVNTTHTTYFTLIYMFMQHMQIMLVHNLFCYV